MTDQNELIFDPQLIRKFDINGPRYTSYPTADRFVEAFNADALKDWLAKRAIGGVQLTGQRIVVVPEDNRVSVYKGANWSDPAPVLVRDRILEAFRVDARIAALSSDEQRLHADFELVSELQAFQSEYRDAAPEVVVRLDARLIQRKDRRILASRVFESRVRPTGAELTQVVAGFGQASTAVASEMVGWAVEVLAPCTTAGCPE